MGGKDGDVFENVDELALLSLLHQEKASSIKSM